MLAKLAEVPRTECGWGPEGIPRTLSESLGPRPITAPAAIPGGSTVATLAAMLF